MMQGNSNIKKISQLLSIESFFDSIT